MTAARQSAGRWGERTRCLVSVCLSPGDGWRGVRAAAASSTPTLRPALERGAWRVRGSPTPPELSLKLLAEKSPRDRWPSNQPSLQAVPTVLEASGTRLPDPRPPGKSSVTRQVKNKELIEVSFFFFFPRCCFEISPLSFRGNLFSAHAQGQKKFSLLGTNINHMGVQKPVGR